MIDSVSFDHRRKYHTTMRVKISVDSVLLIVDVFYVLREHLYGQNNKLKHD